MHAQKAFPHDVCGRDVASGRARVMEVWQNFGLSWGRSELSALSNEMFQTCCSGKELVETAHAWPCLHMILITQESPAQ